MEAGLNIGDAIECMREGNKVARKGWNGRGIYISIHTPSAGDDMTQEYIYIDTTGLVTDNENAPKSTVPWFASQTDLLAEDWVVVG